MNTLLTNACYGKPASKNGLNLAEFRTALKLAYPMAVADIDRATSRSDLETLCKQLMKGTSVRTVIEPMMDTKALKIVKEAEEAKEIKEVKEVKEVKIVKRKEVKELKELPKEYCDDYTLEELAEKAGRNVKLTSQDRERICQELKLPKYQTELPDSLGYSRAIIINISDKIRNNQKLTQEEDRIVDQWNRNHGPLKEELDRLAERFTAGETLSRSELQTLDRELFNKYCRCVLKRKTQDRDLFLSRDLGKIMARLANVEDSRKQAEGILSTETREWSTLSNEEKDAILAKLLPIFMGLAIGGCKSSVYMKSRNIKARNRPCDYDLNNAEILLETNF